MCRAGTHWARWAGLHNWVRKRNFVHGRPFVQQCTVRAKNTVTFLGSVAQKSITLFLANSAQCAHSVNAPLNKRATSAATRAPCWPISAPLQSVHCLGCTELHCTALEAHCTNAGQFAGPQKRNRQTDCQLVSLVGPLCVCAICQVLCQVILQLSAGAQEPLFGPKRHSARLGVRKI